MSKAEKIYDTKVAPLLMRAAKLCEKNGIALTAYCQWGPDSGGLTAVDLTGQTWPATILVYMAAHARGNADALIFAMKRHAEVVGHNSIYLQVLGAKATP